MTTIRTLVQHRRIEVPAPDDLPDGTEVVVEVIPASKKMGLDESEWDDSPEGVAAWLAWLDMLEPISFAEPDAFDEEFRRFNVEVVCQQMGEQES
jgi:hypothetical protein